MHLFSFLDRVSPIKTVFSCFAAGYCSGIDSSCQVAIEKKEMLVFYASFPLWFTLGLQECLGPAVGGGGLFRQRMQLRIPIPGFKAVKCVFCRSVAVSGCRMLCRLFLRGRLLSFRCAFRGLRLLVGGQTNARIHVAATLLVLCAGFWLRLPSAKWGLLTLAIALVWVAEALNTAIERLTDMVSPEYRPLAGEVKDLAAAGVLLAALGAGGIALAVFGPALLAAAATSGSGG